MLPAKCGISYLIGQAYLIQTYKFFGLINTQGKTIFFYDGECGFCNATVRFLLSSTSPNTLLFCKLQSEFADDFFGKHGYPKPDLTTAYLFHRNRLYQKSSAVLKAVSLADGLVKHLGIFFVVPKFVRDGVYNLVATFRKQIKVGKMGCRLLTPSERRRFIEM